MDAGGDAGRTMTTCRQYWTRFTAVRKIVADIALNLTIS